VTNEGEQIMDNAFDLDTGNLVGYARVSTDSQDLSNQRDQLQQADCVQIFSEQITEAKRNRPELESLLDYVQPGDVATVTQLDRLARSTKDLPDIAERLQSRQVGLRSLAEPWADTTTPGGRMVLTVFAGIAEFERSLIVERTRRGRDAAKKKGIKFGRKKALSEEQCNHAKELAEEEQPVRKVAALFGVNRMTIYRELAR